MAIIEQDVTGTVADANSYVSLSYFNTYHENRGFIAEDSFESEAIEAAIIKATDYINIKFRERFSGQKLTSSQETAFPRKYSYDVFGIDISETIPSALKKAVCEYALIPLNGGELSPNPEYDSTGQNIKSIRSRVEGAVDEKIEYKDDYRLNTSREYPKGDMYISELFSPTAGSSYQLLRG